MSVEGSEIEGIFGVLVKPLLWRTDQRGSLMELVRSDDPELMSEPFGQVYCTTLYPGVVKGWHKHTEQWDRMACIHGRVMVGLVDDREDSPTYGRTQRVFMGDRNALLVRIPPGVWHGLKNIGEHEAFVVNVPSAAYDRDAPDEIRERPHGVVNFDWSRVDS